MARYPEMNVECPRCGFYNDPQYVTCWNCDAALEEGEK